ncbi:hypothetical protein [Actinomycetospora lemnae]|uniref:Uncharacterized protein n=1 Tax=Actinomycetospora lemnae TaxID=3019891 RepID=A0ABT5SRJ5_9PSEU|nr:hypothetical protein [Actinomycetospora sp. DW7H6]MDD7965475.1 hypothetical protein [Actinomycetospora sp. DW7H6]
MNADEKADQSAGDKDDTPSELARLSCWIRRAERQAEVAGEKKGDLADLSTRYEAARAAYSEAWTAADVAIGAARSDLEAVTKDVGCKLEADAKKRLDTAWTSTAKRLNECAKPDHAPSVPDCKPDTTKEKGETAASLAGRVHDLRVQAEQRQSLVEALLEEIDDLPRRVKDVEDEIAALKSDLAAPSPDLARLYARALVAGWRLDHIHRGFADIDIYVDLVRQATVGLYQLWQAIAILEGRQAYRACLADASPAGPCAVLLADPVADLLKGGTDGGRATGGGGAAAGGVGAAAGLGAAAAPDDDAARGGITGDR